jgi:hypothetical protein
LLVNCTVVRLLHDAVYPSNTVESPSTTKLRSILKTPEVTNILQGEKLPSESEWAVHPWLGDLVTWLMPVDEYWFLLCLQYTCTGDLRTTVYTIFLM